MLSLRHYMIADRVPLVALFTNPDVTRYAGDGRPMEPKEAHALLDRILATYETDPSFYIWAIQEGQDYAGHAELKRRKGRSEYEIVYFLQKERWGRGLGGSTVDLLLAEAREREIPFVIATVHPENVASVAILRRRKFVRNDRLSAELNCDAYLLDLAMPLAFGRVIPVLRIFDVAKAREFYLDYLGFAVDFEHRFHDNAPLFMQISREGLVFRLSEHHGDGSPGAHITVETSGVERLHAELQAKRYRYMNPGIVETEWSTRDVTVYDPFANHITFSERIER